MPKQAKTSGGTRQRILEAALGTLMQEGFYGATSLAIARAAEVIHVLLF